MKNKNPGKKSTINKRQEDLYFNKEDSLQQIVTTNQGLKINDGNNSLKAGDRGVILLEDFILERK